MLTLAAYSDVELVVVPAETTVAPANRLSELHENEIGSSETPLGSTNPFSVATAVVTPVAEVVVATGDSTGLSTTISTLGSPHVPVTDVEESVLALDPITVWPIVAVAELVTESDVAQVTVRIEYVRVRFVGTRDVPAGMLNGPEKM